MNYDKISKNEKSGENHFNIKTFFLSDTRELPGVALVNISTWPIFMGKGNTLFCEICITLEKITRFTGF